MRRGLAIILSVIILITGSKCIKVQGDELRLNALSACLMDASNNRVLYEKNGYEIRAMASTTKIMTCILALENANLEDTITISSYAAKMPDVQMDAVSGEQYKMEDLLYAMMLESYNDVAVAVAEGVSGDVKSFAKLMNEKAEELGCNDTHFVTPNGLDGSDEGGEHSSTAVDMARIASYAIKNEEFLKITNTRSYSFNELNGERSVSVTNRDAFLDKMEGAIGVKTGFTGKAGYCFVGALERDGKTFISVVLGSGWPPNKNFKWQDTQALMNYGLNNFSYKTIFTPVKKVGKIKVQKGVKKNVETYASGNVSLLIAPEENVTVFYNMTTNLTAPVKKDEIVGWIEIFVADRLHEKIPIKTSGEVKKITYLHCLKKIFKEFLG